MTAAGTAARRSYGSGRVYVRTDSAGRETFYGSWWANARRMNRRLGVKRARGSREGLTAAQAEAELRRLMGEVTPNAHRATGWTWRRSAGATASTWRPLAASAAPSRRSRWCCGSRRPEALFLPAGQPTTLPGLRRSSQSLLAPNAACPLAVQSPALPQQDLMRGLPPPPRMLSGDLPQPTRKPLIRRPGCRWGLALCRAMLAREPARTAL
jgi:hypothetical protein